MRAGELAPFHPTAEVLALGEPERVFADSPRTARLFRALGLVLGTGLLLAAIGLAGWTWVVAPDEVRDHREAQWGLSLAAGVGGALGALFLASALFYGHANAVAVYADAIALTRRGAWVVVPWCEVRAFHPLSLRHFPHLELRDGTRVPLGSDGSGDEELFREIRRAVEGPVRITRAEQPPAAAAPTEAAASPPEGSPWGALIAGSLLVLGAAWFYLYLERLEAEGGDMRIHWVIAVAYNLGGKLAAAGLIAVVGTGLVLGGINGLLNGPRPAKGADAARS